MAESSNPSHIPSPPELIPKEEPDTQQQNRPESPNHFLPTFRVEFEFNEITFNTNNEFSLLYPSHSNSEYFEAVSDFISNVVQRMHLLEHQTNKKNTYLNSDVLMKSKAPKTSSKAKKKVSQGKMHGAKTRLRRKQSSKHRSESKIEANKDGSSSPTRIKTGHSAQETQSSSGMDTNLSQPLVSTPVATDLLKEDQQAGGGPTFLGTTSEEGANLSSVVDVKTNFMDLDSLEDELIFVQDENKEEEEADKYEDTHATSHKENEDSLNQKLEQLKNKGEGEVAFLTAQPSYPNVAQLTELLWELPAEFLALPSQVFSVQSKLKILDAIPGPPRSSPQTEGELIKKDKGIATMSSKDNEEEDTESDFENDYTKLHDLIVESSKKKKLKKFDFVTEGGEHIHFAAEKIKEQKRIEESLKAKLAKQELKNVNKELVDLMGIDVVTKYYKNKLLYDKYYDKMLKRRKSSKITNYDVLTRKGPIIIYREDGTVTFLNFREVVQACLNKEGNVWKTIYEKIKTRMDYLHRTEEELKINFNKPHEEQDPLDELNDLANKKRKRTTDFHDYFRLTKKFKPSVRYEDHLAGFIKDLALMIMPELLVPFYLLK
nr:hypothetical protein [Tanacetum cinerariifolium]GEW80374.1 hypothetical protein [Tanacetum cinerariifolium]